MEIKSPKEIVQSITGGVEDKKRNAFSIKAKSTVNGAFWGGGLGLIIAYKSGKSLYIGALVGALTGAFISNILTVQKK